MIGTREGSVGLGLEIANRGGQDAGPRLVGDLDDFLAVRLVLFERCGVYEEVELAVHDVGKPDVPIEFLANIDAKGAEAAELR